jgi:hypothetical protein
MSSSSSRGRPDGRNSWKRLIEAMAMAVVVGSITGYPGCNRDAGEVFHEGNSDELRTILGNR